MPASASSAAELQNYIIQAGLAGVLRPPHCEHFFRALVNFLRRTGIVSGTHLSDDEDGHYFGPQQSFPVIAENAGLFVSKLKVGRWLRAERVVPIEGLVDITAECRT